MSDTRPYRTYKGKEDGSYPGRDLVYISGYKPACKAALEKAGAEEIKDNTYLLPENGAVELMVRLDTLFIQDRASAINDRVPVAINVAAKHKIGDIFDFGGEVGKAPITNIGKQFIQKKPGTDNRVTVGQEMVYIYNAKNDWLEKKDTGLEKERADRLETDRIEADRTRVPVKKDSVAEGNTISVNDRQVTVTSLSGGWKIPNQEILDKIAVRFPNEAVGFNIGDTICFANFDAPATEAQVDAEARAEAKVEPAAEAKAEIGTGTIQEPATEAKPETVQEPAAEAESETDMGAVQKQATNMPSVPSDEGYNNTPGDDPDDNIDNTPDEGLYEEGIPGL